MGAIKNLWDKAENNPNMDIDLGEVVVCDVCGNDYTGKKDSGGFIFGSYAYCPQCAASRIKDIRRFNEEHMIRARCPEGKSFAEFVINYRGRGATISIRCSQAGKSINDGANAGDKCNVEGCSGVLQDDGSGDGCSCHINPPCSNCEKSFDRLICPECGWSASEE